MVVVDLRDDVSEDDDDRGKKGWKNNLSNKLWIIVDSVWMSQHFECIQQWQMKWINVKRRHFLSHRKTRYSWMHDTSQAEAFRTKKGTSRPPTHNLIFNFLIHFYFLSPFSEIKFMMLPN